MAEFRDWLTREEWQECRLPSFPASRRNFFYKLKENPLAMQPAFMRLSPRLETRGARRPAIHEYHFLLWSLETIVEYETRFGTYREPEPGVGLARRGTGTLDTAEGGKVRALIRQQLRAAPDISAAEIRRMVADRFGERIAAGRIAFGMQPMVDLPPLRTFQAYVAALRDGTD